MPSPVRAFLDRTTREIFRGEIGAATKTNLAFAVVNAALALVTSLVIGRSLGPAGVGILSLGFLVLEFAGTIDNLGTAGFMRDYAAEATPRKLGTVLRLKLFLGVGTSLAILLATPLLAPALDVPAPMLYLLALVPATGTLASVATMVWEARREPWRRNTVGTVEAAAKLAIYGAFWTTFGAGADVVVFAWGTVVASAIGAAVGAFLLPSTPLREFEGARARAYVTFGTATQVSGILTKSVFWCDILIIDVLLGHYAQGLYRTAYAVMAFIPLFAGTVGVFLFPSLSEAVHRGDAVRARALFRASFTHVLAIAVPLAVLTALLARPALSLFGAGFEQADWILRWLTLTAILPCILVPFESLFLAANRPWTAVGIGAAMAGSNVVLDLLLIPTMDVAGAIVATTTAFAVGVTSAVVVVRRTDLFAAGARA